MISIEWDVENGEIVTGSGETMPVEGDIAREFVDRYEDAIRELEAAREALKALGLWVYYSNPYTGVFCKIEGDDYGKTKRFSKPEESYTFAFNYIKTGEWDESD